MDMKRIADVIRTDATNTEQADFLATHLPFKTLYYCNSGTIASNSRTIDEEQFFREEVIRNYERHNFMVVQGHNGSGKSHFIRWLKERYVNHFDESKEAVLLITRSQSTLRGTLEQIINSGIFPDTFKTGELKKLVQANEHLSDEALKRNIVLQFALASKIDDDQGSVLDKRYRKYVYDFLVDTIVQDFLFKKGGPVERIKSKLSSEDNARHDEVEPRFESEDFQFDYKMLSQMKTAGTSRKAVEFGEALVRDLTGTSLRTPLAEFLNKKLEFVIQSCTNLRATDLKQVFEQLRIALNENGKNLTLFIEDITSFTGIDRALVEVLVTEHTGTEYNERFCRVFSVVGVTNHYYQTNFPDNLKDRVTGRILIDAAILQSKEEIGEMAARYINAINLESEDLRKWLEDGAVDLNLPISQRDMEHSWSLFKLGDGRDMSLFPFNLTALHKMYNKLNNKSPRSFLRFVIMHVLQIYVTSEGEFPPAIKDFDAEFEIPLWQNPNHEQRVRQQAGQCSDRVTTLLRLWGDGTAYSRIENGEKTVGSLTADVFHCFGLLFIDGVEDSESTSTSTEALTRAEQETTKRGGLKDQTPLPTQQRTDAELEFDKIHRELENWATKKDKLRSYSELRDIVCDFLRDFIDWQSEGVPGSLVKAHLTNRTISIEGQMGDDTGGFKVCRGEESKSALLALAAWRHLGKRSWNFVGSAGHLCNLHNWTLNVKNDVIRSVIAPPWVEDVSMWTLPKWGLLIEFYLLVFVGKISLGRKSVKDAYIQIFKQNPAMKAEENRSKTWKEIQSGLEKKQHILGTHRDFVTRYYNCIQGSVTGNTDVFFIDAVPVLKTLKELKDSDWKLTTEDYPDVSSKGDDHWYRSLQLLRFLGARAENAITDEANEVEKYASDIENYIGEGFNDKDVIELIEVMKGFLTHTMVEANEAYPSNEFKPFLEGQLTAKGLLSKLRGMKQVTSATDYYDRLAGLSAHPVQGVLPYYQLLKGMDALTEEKSLKYKAKLEDLSQTNDISQVMDDIRGALDSLKNALIRVDGRGVGSVSQ